MKRLSASKFVLCALLCGVAAPSLFAQDATQQIKTEIERLQKSLQDNPVTDTRLMEMAEDVKKGLDAAASALSAGKVYLSLEQLGKAENVLLGLRAVGEEAEVAKGGLPEFEKKWGKASLKLMALDAQAREHDWSHAPAAAQGLSEAAQRRAIPLLDGGRGFATSTGPADGLFYVGQAEGEAEFARFVASLSIRRTGTALSLRSYSPELASLQKKSNDAFRPPKSIEMHPRFIALNSTIKLAQELDARKFYAGALYEYMEAVRHYGMLNAQPVDSARQKQVREGLDAAKKKLAGSAADSSLAQLFLDRAASYVQHTDGSAPSADEWKAASVVLNEVLPAYYAALMRPAPASKSPTTKTVAITLVRWPYT